MTTSTSGADRAGSTGILFDVDGTLVDTTFLHTVCWADALADAGHIVPMARIHHAIGMGSSELLDHLLGKDRDTDADDGVVAARLTLYRQHWGRLRRLPGAAQLLRACAGRGHQVVLASSASQDELAALRGALDCDDVISEATSSSDAEGGSPIPTFCKPRWSRPVSRPIGSCSSATRCGTAPRPNGRACGSSR